MHVRIMKQLHVQAKTEYFAGQIQSELAGKVGQAVALGANRSYGYPRLVDTVVSDLVAWYSGSPLGSQYLVTSV